MAIWQTFNDTSVRYFHWHIYLLLTRFILYVPLLLLGPWPPYCKSYKQTIYNQWQKWHGNLMYWVPSLWHSVVTPSIARKILAMPLLHSITKWVFVCLPSLIAVSVLSTVSFYFHLRPNVSCCVGLHLVDGIKDLLSGIFRLAQFWYDFAIWTNDFMMMIVFIQC